MGEGTAPDLAQLRGLPITELRIGTHEKSDIDVAPLLDLPKLEKFQLGSKARNLPLLRTHPTIKFIALPGEGHRPAAEFWAEYDAQRPPEK